MNINERLKELINYNPVFLYYRQGEMWYKIEEEGEILFEFPIPISDTGTGVFHHTMRGPELMRWIRKHLEAIEAGKKEQGIS